MAGKSKKKQGTKQTLEYVEEPKKFHVKPLKCKNAKQKEYLKLLEGQTPITICSGIPGSGKTFLALYAGLKMLEKQQIEQILLVKSVTQLPGEELGYMKGDQTEKIANFMESYFGNIDKIIGIDQRKALIGEGKIRCVPLALIRGCTFSDCMIILDEAQNITMELFKTIVTRIGENSHFVILGDEEQIDLRAKSKSALTKIKLIFEQETQYVGVVEFGDDDCIRNPMIPIILNKLREFERNEIVNQQK